MTIQTMLRSSFIIGCFALACLSAATAWNVATAKDTSSDGKQGPFFRDGQDKGPSAPAMPQADEQGAKWKLSVPKTSRKASLLGRESAFSRIHFYIACGNVLRERDFETGRPNFFVATHLSAGVNQIVEGFFQIAGSTIKPNGEPSGDILFLDRMRARPQETLLIGHSEPAWRLLFSPSELRLVSCSDDGSIRLWDIDQVNALGRVKQNGRNVHPNPSYGQEIAKFPGYGRNKNGKAVRGELAAFSPYGRWLATAHDQTVSFRLPLDGSEFFTWKPKLTPSQRIMAIRFDPHGNTLLAFLEDAKASERPTLKFLQFDIDTNKDREFQGIHGVVDGRATADGKYVVAWNGSPDIVFWDLKTAKESAVIQATPQHIYDVAFSPMGDVMATAGDDGEVKFWKVADQTQMKTGHPFKHDNVDLVQFSDDGKYLVTGSDDGWLKSWDAPEFCWNRREPTTDPIIINIHGNSRQIFSDGAVLETGSDGSVKETMSDGTVKTYKRQ